MNQPQEKSHGQKNPQKSDIQYDVIRDTREQHGWSFSRSKTVANVHDQKLDTGDYAVVGFEKYLCIERKATVAEIACNINEKRFFAELDRMVGFPHKFIICEFSFTNIENYPAGCGIPKDKIPYIKVTPQYIAKKLTEIALNYDIHIVYAGGPRQAEEIADNIMRKTYEKYCQ